MACDETTKLFPDSLPATSCYILRLGCLWLDVRVVVFFCTSPFLPCRVLVLWRVLVITALIERTWWLLLIANTWSNLLLVGRPAFKARRNVDVSGSLDIKCSTCLPKLHLNAFQIENLIYIYTWPKGKENALCYINQSQMCSRSWQ